MYDEKNYTGNEGYNALVKKGWEQMIDNIENDPMLDSRMKGKFRACLNNFKCSSDIKDYCNSEFFYSKKKSGESKYKCRGDEVTGMNGEKQGHAARKKDFIREIKRVLMADRINVLTGMIESLMVKMDDTGKAADYSKKLIKYYKLSDYHVRPHYMWSFKDLEKDTYAGYDKDDLPCLLGLPGADGVTAAGYEKYDYITFEFAVSRNLKVHKPTAFDAGVNILWRPGGYTVKHDDGGKYSFGGLKEFFHKPIKFSDITSNIYIIPEK